MIAGVADTHTVIWYLFDDARLSTTAGDFIDQAAANGERIGVSPITLAEIVYLLDKKKIPPTTYTEVRSAMIDPDHVFQEVPFSIEVVEAMRTVARDEVSDMPDRIVAATGVYFGVPVISRDGRIRAANLKTLW